MSIYRVNGLVRKPSGILFEIVEQIKKIDLRPCTKVEYKLDPFHPAAKEVREFSFILSNPKIRESNFKCTFKTVITSDGTPPEINCKLVNGKELLFKAEHLTVLEILEEFNQITLPLLPPPEAVSVPLKTKSQKRK